MNFKKGFGRAPRPIAPSHTSSQAKGSAGVALSGFSFKQLEEDEDGEDLTSYTGKYEKVVEHSQKAIKRDQERSMSTSSVSSTSSGQEDIKPDKNPSARGTQVDTESKQHSKTQSIDVAGSPLRLAARQKIETSKELFSGLKGKIADKISRTIDEFSGDQSPKGSPEKEIAKPILNDDSHNESSDVDLVVKETVPVLRSAPPQHDTDLSKNERGKEQANSEKQDEEEEPKIDDLSQDKKPVSAKNSVSDEDVDEQSNVPVSETITPSAQSVSVEDHPLANLDGEDDFEDVLETSSTKRNLSVLDDSTEFHDPQNTSGEAADFLMFHEHFDNVVDPNDASGFSTSTKVKSRSVIKRLGKKERKTSAVATMSALHDAPDEELVVSGEAEKTVLASSQKASEPKKHPSSLNIPVTNSSQPNNTSPLGIGILSLDPRSLPYQKLVAVAVALFAYLIVPLPSYLSGLIMGVLLSSVGWGVYMWLTEPPKQPEPFIIPPLEEAPPVPEMKITTEAEEFTYKGWLNELEGYNVEDYHINKTHSVFISLEGSHLRIQRPKNPVPKRAMWDEVLPKPQFIHQRHFDLPGASVYLVPDGLVKKRIWSKKYPICIDLNINKSTNGEPGSSMKHISSDPNMSDKKDKSHVHGFEIVTEEKCEHRVLYLFARTGREKEEWFRRLAAAAKGTPLGNHVMEMRRVINHWSPSHHKISEPGLRSRREGSTDSLASLGSESAPELTVTKKAEKNDLLPFAHYMGRLMPSGSLSRASSPSHHALPQRDSTKASTPRDGGVRDPEESRAVSPKNAIICDGQLFWVNALIGRCFFDFLRDKWWIGKVTEKLQRKLSKIHVPYFIEELQVTDIHMGYEMPTIRNAGKPYIDERGFWVDLDITYSGGFTMTIETKMNLMKLKKSTHHSQSTGHSVDSTKSAITHSDEEDSAESSTDEEEEVPSTADENGAGGGSGSGKKFFRYLNKITQSKYFQQATEYGVIKRAMENVSNTPLTLTVTVNSLVGKLALNIPPPHSDRLWYGFRSNPLLRLSAKPQVGERAVKITHVTEWIEKKLALEFQRVFVMPNMDDLVIPILVPGEVSGTGLTHSVSL
ncbi:testis-expressed sequence 2 protein-like [Plakobranchus ocellatus]|uniref:Testis-expressed sequence 2 protein-like n=1 Tax=Plakobranchus ocellatus TaxID=259542 RepID=A0AAV4A2C1_9GAST|nr:testis-expressed sequence 2 protein-like [Plakobranchus ocellatus]